MDREEARELLLGYSRFINEETDLWEALDLAIEALKGDLYCPKCGTIVRDGRQYHDLVYRGEAEPIKGDAESATTTDCISRADTLKALCAECDANSHCYYPDKEAYCTEYAIVKGMPPVNQKQITGKLKNPCDSLLTEDSESVKEQKSKLESDTISRQAAIDAVEKAVFKGVAKSAIESLPPVTPTVSEDCISKAFALEVISDYVNYPTEGDKTCAIKNAPSVTPTERTGEWIPCTKGGLPLTELGRRERQKWYGYKCSKCNFIYKGNALTESPFCQNCGAKMVGDKE